MDPITKADLVREGGKIISFLLRASLSRPKPSKEEKEELVAEGRGEIKLSPESNMVEVPLKPSSSIALPTAEETTIELKRRLGRELYRAELDLAAGLKIAGKPCDCLSNKHTLMLEAAAEELISQDPGNSVYQDIIDWIPANRSKFTPEAIVSGTYASEYPRMANDFKNFRKRVMGSVGTPEAPAGKITLELAKKMAAEEAAKEVEKAWNKEV